MIISYDKEGFIIGCGCRFCNGLGNVVFAHSGSGNGDQRNFEEMVPFYEANAPEYDSTTNETNVSKLPWFK